MAVARRPERLPGYQLQEISESGEETGPRITVETVAGLAEWAAGGHRWLWDSAAAIYPALVSAGIRVARCHDVALTERILLSRQGQFGAPVLAAAVRARAMGEPVPDDRNETPGPPALFDATSTRPAGQPDLDPIETLRISLADQRRRIGADRALALLVAAESASGLAAVEMSVTGLPWRADIHLDLLAELLGPRPPAGHRPARLAVLAADIDKAFGFPVNPDSAVDVRTAFRRAGFDIESTRSWILKEIDHPAVPAVLRYKELSRVHTANGWNWLDEWARNGRFHPEYLPGAVVSGRWATRGGGALQIPRGLRQAVVADPGHRLVVADAAQLEPRVLAAISGDVALQRVSAVADLYTALADDGFGGDRAHAKVAMLGAMYGA
ncbi:MAG: bifunctional 3'-5' exonuclease/DNA polymerase, partial [Nakamurella sp.]